MNEPPFDVNVTDEYGLMNFSRGMPRVDENTSKGTIIGKVVAKDYDANDTLMFFLDDDSGGHFALETTTCQSEAGVAVRLRTVRCASEMNNFLTILGRTHCLLDDACRFSKSRLRKRRSLTAHKH